MVIIFIFQVIVALPFVLGDSTVANYIHRSKLTGAGRNGILYAAQFWDYCAAARDLSIFYSWWDPDTYYQKEKFADIVKRAMLLSNIYHFFIRKNSTPRCFENLFRTFDNSNKLGITSFS